MQIDQQNGLRRKTPSGKNQKLIPKSQEEVEDENEGFPRERERKCEKEMCHSPETVEQILIINQRFARLDAKRFFYLLTKETGVHYPFSV